LLDATLVLIGREGTGRGLSLRAAARLAGVSEAAPYRHFADKRALIAAVAEEGFDKMEAALAEVSDGDLSDPLERFQALGVVYVRFACAHPAHYKVMFGPEMTDKSAYPSLENVAQRAFAHLARAVSDCQGAGLLRPGDPRELALAAWSAVHGLSSLVVDGQVRIVGFEPGEAERLAASVSRDLLSGLTDANR
jgi:AcrR family transcriptional regulator